VPVEGLRTAKEHGIHGLKASQGWMMRLFARNNLSPSAIVQKENLFG
jgi:hypothetical protein